MSAGLVVVGAGVAGHAAAVAARGAGYRDPITLVGEERELPYDRPAISKRVLVTDADADAVALSPKSRYVELGIDLRLGARATAIDPETRTVALDTGDELRFDSAIVATGSRSSSLPLPGFDCADVHALRSLAEAFALRDRLNDRPRVVVVGAGLVGCEFAAAAVTIGCRVTLVDIQPAPLQQILGAELALRLGSYHAERGVDVLMDVGVTGARREGGRLRSILLTDGSELPCDLALVAVGARPEHTLLSDAGALLRDGGIAVDDRCMTSLSGIYAAGDTTVWQHPLSRDPMRVEHFENAVRQGQQAGRAVAGEQTVEHAVPTFWSDQYDLSILWAGFPGPYDEVVLRASSDGSDATAFYVADGCVRALATVNRPRDMRHGRRLIEAQRRVPASKLVDLTIELAELL